MFKAVSRFASIIYISCTLSACALIKPTPDELNNKINTWLADNNYNEIDSALGSINKTDTSYNKVLKRKNEINAKKQRYISSIIATAKKHKANNQWEYAIQSYEDGLDNVEHKTLHKELTSLIAERDKKAQRIKTNLLIKSANDLVSYKNSYYKLNQLLPNDYSTQYEITRYNNKISTLIKNLNECAEKSKQLKEYSTANECYALANKLDPTSKKQKIVTTRIKPVAKPKPEKKYSKLFAAYELAHKNKEYEKAQANINKILSLNPQHKKANKLNKVLLTEINELVDSKIDLGKNLYTQKKIQAALVIWKQAQKLAPHHGELGQLIIRAEKVSKKIESLEHNQ